MSDEGFLQPYMILNSVHHQNLKLSGPNSASLFSPGAGSPATKTPAQRPREVTTPGPEGRGFPA